MKRIELNAYGVPEDVARCVEVADVGAPDAGEVVFDVIAFPINPADVSFCRGGYRIKPPLPATPGAECVGRVSAVGAGVGHVKPGDLVINLQRENWAQKRRVKGADVIRLPAGVELRQAAMLRINPPTALLLLTDIVDVPQGGWIIQNVANSAVGRLVISIAKGRGIRTVNVVRRTDVIDELKSLGADVCLLDGPDLADRMKAATGGAAISLGLDAVSGAASARMAACVADGGTVCTYGAMSGESPQAMTVADLIYRGVTQTGFMLGRFLAKRSAEEIENIYAELAARIMDGTISAPVDHVYEIGDIRAALIRAQEGGRDGKILVAPNGMI
ncbi:MAG TPA: zinc-dependent alcohol dehydrogenase family protein [Parvibaculum sp.]|jgi:NADPH:quinone reductase-like Zn-dependent oxidoreductase